MLSYEISKIYGKDGLIGKKFNAVFHGSAGQSFGAFLASGVNFKLIGEANDYLGKGLSGGTLILQSFKGSEYKAQENIITGNVAFYGATSGKAYLNGMAGERFCVRNSGVEAVVEGIGDHGCEYMTGGKVLILGEVGKNFAAGMSGGMAFVLDRFNAFEEQCNLDMVTIETPSEEDYNWIKLKLSEHSTLTGSDLAYKLIEQWELLKQYFKKVMPDDLKKVLEAQEKESETIKKVA
jgi:glutamate synthase (NADPH) large chain